jgi:hypothetical protein
LQKATAEGACNIFPKVFFTTLLYALETETIIANAMEIQFQSLHLGKKTLTLLLSKEKILKHVFSILI